MTKKHFIELADSLKEIRRRIRFGAEDTATAEYAISVVEDEICRFCRGQNGRFMQERFLEYSRGKCGPNGGDIKK